MTAPSLGSPLPRYTTAAPRALGAAGRAVAGAAAGATPRALVVALAAFLVINFARAHEGFWFLLPLHLAKLTGVPLIVLAISKLPRPQLRAALRTWPGRWMLFIGLMMVLSVPFSIWRGYSFAYLRGTAPISYMMFITTAAVLVDRRAALTILKAEVLAVASGAVRMHLPGAPVYMEGGVARALFGWTYDPNDTAVLFLVSIPLAIYLGSRPGRWRAMWYGCALVMVLSLVRTGSRGGLLGLAAMLVALVVMAPPRQRVRLFGVGVLIAVAFGVAVRSNPVLRDRFESMFQSDYNQTSANGRVEIWKRGVHYMITHPLTGVGINNYTVAELQIGSELKAREGIVDRHMFTAHNSLVQIGAELGIPGLFAFLAMVATAARGLWRVRGRAAAAARRGARLASDEAALASAVLTSISGLFVGGFFLSLAYSPMTYFTYALAAAVIAGSTFGQGGLVNATAEPSHDAPLPRPRGRRGGLWRGPTGESIPVGVPHAARR